MKTIFSQGIIFILLLTSDLFGQTGLLRQEIENIIATKKASVGVSVLGIEDGDTLSINGDKNYPLMSVFKFPIALYALHKVDEGALDLDREIPIEASDLTPDTWSPIRDKYPNGNVRLSLADILTYTVSQSDNIGCDILLKLIGGTAIVQNYISEMGVDGFIIKVNEEAMYNNFSAQRINTATPLASTQLLKFFYGGKILSKESNAFLKKLMIETSTGNNRLKGKLPAGTVVAHKTGTSDTDKEGLIMAINDIGIITLPYGNHFAISIFVSDSKEDTDTVEKVIADITKLVFDYFNSKVKSG